MSHRLDRQSYQHPPSPASSDTSVSSNIHANPPRYPQRDAIHPRPVQSLPPLRAFLRNEGIDTDIEPRQPCLIGATHEVAREEARRRALRAAATRCHARIGPVLGYEHRNGASVDGQSTVRALDESCRMGHSRRNHYGEPSSPYPKVTRRTMPASSIVENDRHARKAISPSRSYRSRDTVEERMSREVEPLVATIPPPLPPLVAPAARDKTVSPIPSKSRKRPRPVYLESDDEDSDDDSSRHSYASNVLGTGKDRLSVRGDSDDVGTSDSDTRDASERERRGSSIKPKGEKGLDKGPEREYYSPSGIKLEVIELPVKYDTKEWLKHVEQCPDGSKAPWRCTWQTMKNGSPVPCDYSSKKHLVKRHIEATHLCIKRFQCTWCEKTFTQRSNVAGCHLNTHTGASPHGCEFCGDRFKDPSKRHKHMLRSHGYRPGESRKKFRSEESAQGQSAHESLEPWKVAGGRDC